MARSKKGNRGYIGHEQTRHHLAKDLQDWMTITTRHAEKHGLTVVSSLGPAIAALEGGSMRYDCEVTLHGVQVPRKAPPGNYSIVVGVSIEWAGQGAPNADPLSSLVVEISTKGHCLAYDSPMVSEWHLDRHVGERSIEEGTRQYEVHPRYHIQYGGNKTKGIESGTILLMAPPRWAVPPMDLILAMDFVFANFCGRFWEAISQEPDYGRIVSNSHKLLWEPYVSSLWAHWSGAAPRTWEPHDIWPSMRHNGQGR